MPIYEYECETCNYRHEALQKVSDPVLTTCPSCGESSLRKLISAAGFRLSGSGWYETDFKSENKRNLASKDSQKKSDNKESRKSDKKDDGKNSSSKSNSPSTGEKKNSKST